LAKARWTVCHSTGAGEQLSAPVAGESHSGVGKVTEQRLGALGIRTVNDLRQLPVTTLQNEFGRYGIRLYDLARGIDETRVIPIDRPNPFLPKTPLTMMCP
jgi:nucleotidyltransferase/DNA polymerase involved in DNA repair